MDWISNSGSSHKIFWITGMAGTGKTAIMRTISDHLDEKSLLGASFFISRYAALRRNPHHVVRTILHQLAHSCQELRPVVCNALRSDNLPLDHARDVETYDFTGLLEQVSVNAINPIFLVLDALNECDYGDKTSTHGGEYLLDWLQLVQDYMPHLRLILSSRPLHSWMSDPYRVGPRFKMLDRLQADADIRLFLDHHLREIAHGRPELLASEWPPHGAVDDLARLSGGLFICASTLVKHIADPACLPTQQLRSLMKSTATVRRTSNAFSEIDHLYRHILDSAVLSPRARAEGLQLRPSRVRTLLGTLLVLQEPLPVSILAQILGRVPAELANEFMCLSSVLLVPGVQSMEPVQMIHMSFGEFLLDHSRCKDRRFFIDQSYYHDLVASPCVESNLCEATSSLDDYAHQFWMYHLERAPLATSNKAIITCQDVLDQQPLDVATKIRALSCLSQVLRSCSQRGGDWHDLWRSIDILGELLSLRGPWHPDRADALYQLAVALLRGFEMSGDATMISKAIGHLQESLTLRPIGHRDRALSLRELANATHAFFTITHQVSLLSVAEGLSRGAVKLCSLAQRERTEFALAYESLGTVLRSRFDQYGNMDVLEEASRCYDKVVQLLPPGHPHQGAVLTGLADTLLLRLKIDTISDDPELASIDFKRITGLYHQALQLHSRRHPRRRKTLQSLAQALELGYVLFNDDTAHFEAVERLTEVLEMCPPGHPERMQSLTRLATALLYCLQLNATNHIFLDDLAAFPDSSQLRIGTHMLGVPKREMPNTSLLSILDSRTRRKVSMPVFISEAITMLREVHKLCPHEHPYRITALLNLARALVYHHEMDQSAGYCWLLEEATSLCREALQMSRTGYDALTHRTCLNDLAHVLRMRDTSAYGDSGLTLEADALNAEARALWPEQPALPVEVGFDVDVALRTALGE
jgi:tetratricopeptide (TPR) repeat protein